MGRRPRRLSRLAQRSTLHDRMKNSEHSIESTIPPSPPQLRSARGPARSAAGAVRVWGQKKRALPLKMLSPSILATPPRPLPARPRTLRSPVASSSSVECSGAGRLPDALVGRRARQPRRPEPPARIPRSRWLVGSSLPERRPAGGGVRAARAGATRIVVDPPRALERPPTSPPCAPMADSTPISLDPPMAVQPPLPSSPPPCAPTGGSVPTGPDAPRHARPPRPS